MLERTKKKKITRTIEKEYEITAIWVWANVRYWEDATINGEEHEDGHTVPFKDGDNWGPRIDIDTGIVLGWPKDTTARIHFKVCDGFACEVVANDGEIVARYEGYVPRFMCPNENGCGDYIIMNIDGAGKIEGWRFDFYGVSGLTFMR